MTGMNIRSGMYNFVPDTEWLATYSDTETKMNQVNQDNGSLAVDHRASQWESYEITSTSIDNNIDNFTIDDDSVMIFSSRDGLG